MAQLIEHIDAIARRKKADVVMITFHNPDIWIFSDEYTPVWYPDYETYPPRQRMLHWLDERKYRWVPCGHFADEDTLIAYRGQIYVDVLFDESDPQYRDLATFLETPNGVMRQEGIFLSYVTLENAMTNAHHDEPRFWEQWAEEF